MNVSFLVLLYKKTLLESKTIQSIFREDIDFRTSSLIIWNNGPSEIDAELNEDLLNRWCKVELIETLENMPLSLVYNKFIESYHADRYVILDDDSLLTKEYLTAITNTQSDVALPVIYSQLIPRSPTVQGVFNKGPYKSTDQVIAIGSGMSVRYSITQKIKSYYGDVFDSHFALYGVDTTFFLRLHHLGLSDSIEVVDGFEHSLSRLENESQVISRFRQIERAYDLGLTLRHYIPLSRALYICLKQIMKFFLGRFTWLQLKFMLAAYIDGKHPKCKNY